MRYIAHSTTKARHPQTNGICERVHRAILEEFNQVAFRTTVYTTLEQLQIDVDEGVRHDNEERPHSGRYCDGQTPWQTFQETKPLAQAKMLDHLQEPPRTRDPADTQLGSKSDWHLRPIRRLKGRQFVVQMLVPRGACAHGGLLTWRCVNQGIAPYGHNDARAIGIPYFLQHSLPGYCYLFASPSHNSHAAGA